MKEVVLTPTTTKPRPDSHQRLLDAIGRELEEIAASGRTGECEILFTAHQGGVGNAKIRLTKPVPTK